MEFDQNIELMLIKSHEMQPKHLNGKIGTVRPFLGIIFFSAPLSGSLNNFSINTKKCNIFYQNVMDCNSSY